MSTSMMVSQGMPVGGSVLTPRRLSMSSTIPAQPTPMIDSSPQGSALNKLSMRSPEGSMVSLSMKSPMVSPSMTQMSSSEGSMGTPKGSMGTPEKSSGTVMHEPESVVLDEAKHASSRANRFDRLNKEINPPLSSEELALYRAIVDNDAEGVKTLVGTVEKERWDTKLGVILGKEAILGGNSLIIDAILVNLSDFALSKLLPKAAGRGNLMLTAALFKFSSDTTKARGLVKAVKLDDLPDYSPSMLKGRSRSISPMLNRLSVNTTDKVVVTSGSLAVIAYLLEKDTIDIDDEALIQAVRMGSIPKVKLILSARDSNKPGLDSIARIALSNSNPKVSFAVISLLLDHGLNPTSQNLLTNAVSVGANSVVALLLRRIGDSLEQKRKMLENNPNLLRVAEVTDNLEILINTGLLE